MKFFIIAGEASGDLHASHLMRALRERDAHASFVGIGGDRMGAEGCQLLEHYKNLAFMGIWPVLRHLPTILRGMRDCRRRLLAERPDAVILVDYPGFNLSMARFVKRHDLCPVFYYISPKIWAWKERRIKQIKRYVDRLFSILPFEVDFFEKKHHYPISYVGNPTADEVSAYIAEHGEPQPDPHLYALLPGSRRQEVKDNLPAMLQAVVPTLEPEDRLVVAAVTTLPKDFYDQLIRANTSEPARVELRFDAPYSLLSHAVAACVTSGTATLETALFRVPQVVCYRVSFGPLVRLLRRLVLKVPYISLVNLICGTEAVKELVADEMNPVRLREEFLRIRPGGVRREEVLRQYEEMANRLGGTGAPVRAAEEMWRRLSPQVEQSV